MKTKTDVPTRKKSQEKIVKVEIDDEQMKKLAQEIATQLRMQMTCVTCGGPVTA